ncbi:pre-VI, partial [Murine adenovirus 1]
LQNAGLVSSPPAPIAAPAAIAVPAQTTMSHPASSRRRHHWQGTLDSIMGLGLQPIKRRRCF